jgi:hypothetical protein
MVAEQQTVKNSGFRDDQFLELFTISSSQPLGSVSSAPVRQAAPLAEQSLVVFRSLPGRLP